MSEIEYLNRLELEFERLVATAESAAARPTSVAARRGWLERLVPRSPLGRVASVVAVAVVVAAVVGVMTSSPGSDEVDNASAAQILNQTATAATLSGSGEIPDGEYLHWTVTVNQAQLSPIVNQYWLSNTGAGRWVSNENFFTHKPEHFDETFSDATWASASPSLTIPKTAIIGLSRFWSPFALSGRNGFATRNYSYPQMLTLPKSSDALLRLAGVATAPAVMRYQSLAWFASQVALPADRRAELFRALARMPGIKRTDTTTVDGQHLVGIAYYAYRMPQNLGVVEFLLDPKTGYVAQVRSYDKAKVTQVGADRISVSGQQDFTASFSQPTVSNSTN